MLRLVGEQVESLFDEALPIEVRELPDDLARVDGLLSDPALLAPIAERWEASARDRGRPTIAMALFVQSSPRTWCRSPLLISSVKTVLTLR